VCVRGDWREQEKVIRPGLLELQARRNGITRVEIAQALGASFEGRTVAFYREPGGAATGVYPQETRLLPVVARPPLAERDDVHAIASSHIWSPVAGRMIPLSQVTSGPEVVWQDAVVMRRDRFMPLAMIGVTAGLLLTGKPFGFMALLGVLSLGGELIKNQIVVLSKIFTEVHKGKSPYQAILDGGVSKMRPGCMVVLTTVLGSIPLLTDPFFGAMAVCIIFGLLCAAVLSLIVTPVLYAIFFNIHEPTAPGKVVESEVLP
jgi:multidrug efflux pump subunit AcrB